MEITIIILIMIAFLGSLARRLNSKKEESFRDSSIASSTNNSIDTGIDTGIDNSIDSQIDMEKEMEQKEKPETIDETPITFVLMFEALTSLGCQPTKNDDETISVSYQGENFVMKFGGMYCRVWDPMWSGIKADDPNLPKVREAVNDANFGFGPTVVLTAPDEDGIISFHSRRDIMLHPACPDNAIYVKAVLDSFFDMKANVRARFQQLHTEQQNKAPKMRRPVGFSASESSSNED